MALINCPHCSNLVSDKALKCPHCGNLIGNKVVKCQQNGNPTLVTKIISSININKRWLTIFLCLLSFLCFVAVDYYSIGSLVSWKSGDYYIATTCTILSVACILALTLAFVHKKRILFSCLFSLAVLCAAFVYSICVYHHISANEIEQTAKNQALDSLESIKGRCFSFNYNGYDYKIEFAKEPKYLFWNTTYRQTETTIECLLTTPAGSFNESFQIYDSNDFFSSKYENWLHHEDESVELYLSFSKNFETVLCNGNAIQLVRLDEDDINKREKTHTIKSDEFKNIHSKDMSAFMLHGKVKTVTYYLGQSFSRCTFNELGSLIKYEIGDNHNTHQYPICHEGNNLLLSDELGSWVEVYEVDDENRLVKYERSSSSEGFGSRYLYYYHDSNNCPRIAKSFTFDIFDNSSQEGQTIKLTYSDIDEFGNWCICKENENSDLEEIIHREITYYAM